jgi:hypothetical protein
MVLEAGTSIVTKEYDEQAQAAISQTLQETQQQLAQLQEPVQAEVNGVVSEYDRKVSNINNAVAQGAIGSSTAKMRLDSLTREYARRFPGFASEFTSRNTDLTTQAASLFEQDAAMAAQKVQAAEVQRVRNMVIDANRDPNNPNDVAIVRLFGARAAAAQARKIEAELRAADDEERAAANAGVVQVEITGRLGALVSGIQARMAGIASNPTAPGANEAYLASKAELTNAISQARLQVIGNLPANSEESKALLAVIESFESTLETASDANKLLAWSNAANNNFESSLKHNFLARLPPSVAGAIASGQDISRVGESYQRLLLDTTAEATMGSIPYRAIRRSLEAQLGVIRASDQVRGAAVQGAIEDALDPNKPTTVNSAAAAEVMLRMFTEDSTTEDMDEKTTNLLYRRLMGLPPGKRISLGGIATRIQNEQNQRGTNTVFTSIRNTPELEAQLRFAIGRFKQDISRYENVRLRHHADEQGWDLLGEKDGRTVILQTSKPFFVPSEDPSVGSNEISFPLSGEIRDTMNGIQVLYANGLLTQDMKALLDELNSPAKPANQSSQ